MKNQSSVDSMANGRPIEQRLWVCAHTAFLNFKFDFEKTVDPHAIVRNNTERSYIPFAQFPPVVTSYKAIVQCHNQGGDIDTIHSFIQISSVFFCVFVYLFLCSFVTCVALYIHHYSQDTE